MTNLIGLMYGLGSVFLSQIFIILYFYIYIISGFAEKNRIQNKIIKYDFKNEALSHLFHIEGLLLLGFYLSFTWIFNLMPSTYYQNNSVNWFHVLQQSLLVDFLQTIIHIFEHKSHFIHKNIYIISHKPHHKFFNPYIFNAFNGSLIDTFLMIIVPLFITAQTIHCSLWSYIIFGNIYSIMLTLIHSEYHHPFDKIFRKLGIGTAADHNIHHKLQKYNYGHLFMYWDYMFNTYKNPEI